MNLQTARQAIFDTFKDKDGVFYKAEIEGNTLKISKEICHEVETCGSYYGEQWVSNQEWECEEYADFTAVMSEDDEGEYLKIIETGDIDIATIVAQRIEAEQARKAEEAKRAEELAVAKAEAEAKAKIAQEQRAIQQQAETSEPLPHNHSPDVNEIYYVEIEAFKIIIHFSDDKYLEAA